jgi:hypothetical protein
VGGHELLGGPLVEPLTLEALRHAPYGVADPFLLGSLGRVVEQRPDLLLVGGAVAKQARQEEGATGGQDDGGDDEVGGS